jgi:hypothetical protein
VPGAAANALAERLRITSAGTVKIVTLAGGGGSSLCRNASNEISACSSSLRYKENVKPFLPGLDLLGRLRPVAFNWKDGGERDLGFVAEEVAEVEPLLATYNERGEVEGVKYDRLSAVFINAIKEQQQLIEQQARRNEEQARQIERLQGQLNQVKRTLGKRRARIK